MHFQINFYRFEEHLGAADVTGSLAEAEKEAIEGLARFGADRAKISDMADGEQTVMVIVG